MTTNYNKIREDSLGSVQCPTSDVQCPTSDVQWDLSGL